MKNFNILKNDYKKEDKQPDYSISVNEGTQEEPDYKDAGGCWLKETKTGSKYFSCKLNDAYQDRKGYSITIDGLNAEETAKAESTISKELDSEDVAESIPF